MEELQQALDEYLDELSRQAQEQAPADSRASSSRTARTAQTRRPRRTCRQMLDRARELMRSGARTRRGRCWPSSSRCSRTCRPATSRRSSSLAGRADAGRPAEDDPAPAAAARPQLQHGPRRSRAGSSSKASRGSRAQQGQQRQAAAGRAAAARRASRADQMGQAAAEQEALRRALGELMRRMGEAGMEIPRALGQAELQMRDARGACRAARPAEAADVQTQAVDSMQRGGQAMMEQLQRADGAAAGRRARATSRDAGRPPRPRPARPADAQRRRLSTPAASRCRSRASSAGRATCSRSSTAASGDRSRPPAELDYYRRLLDRF